MPTRHSPYIKIPSLLLAYLVMKPNRRSYVPLCKTQLRIESLEQRRLLAADLLVFQNPRPSDVTDQYVSPVDALAIINQLNSPKRNSKPSVPCSIHQVTIFWLQMTLGALLMISITARPNRPSRGAIYSS